jgi:prepilin-type N-terminal cleavage/methylation domain-containing protein
MKNISKKGMSLVEMLVAIAIFSIGIAGFTALFVNSWRSNSFIVEEGQTNQIATRAVDSIVKNLRKIRQSDNGDYPIKSGDGFNLTVYVDDDDDGTTERVHYYLNGQILEKGVTNPTTASPPVYPTGDQTVTAVANYVTNTSGQPIFYYYNKNYPGDTVNNPLATSPALAVDQVKLLKIQLWVNIKPNTAPDNVNFESFVDLRNLNENI